MSRARSIPTAGLLLSLGLAFCNAQPAFASSIGVSPVHVYFSRSSPSALLALTNQGKESVNLSLSAFAWSQGETGEIKLTPTQDVIFFPASLTLAPGESRNIRLGTEFQPTKVEQTYRILVNELPPPRIGHPNPNMEVRILSQISIPLFLEPDEQRVQADLSGISLQKSRLEFQLNNTGSVHVLPNLTVTALDGSGGVVYRLGPQQIWYALAAGSRTVAVPLPAKSCAKVRMLSISLELNAKVNSSAMTKNFPAAAGACRP